MRKRSRILLRLSLVLILGGFAWLMLRPNEPEPLYQGKPLSYWLQGFSPSYNLPRYNNPPTNANTSPTRAEAQAAVQHLGTNAIPTLLRFMSTPDTSLLAEFFQLVQRQRFIHIPYTSSWERAQEAERGFYELGPKMVWGVPQLIQIFDQHRSRTSRQMVPDILGRINPPAKEAVPMLVKATTDPDTFVRNNSVFALGQIHAEPALVVPALIKCLDDPASYTRAHAARALAAFGQDARPAVPALLKLLAREGTNSAPTSALSGMSGNFDTIRGPHPTTIPFGPFDVAGPVISALKTIDPEAAAQAGIK